MKAFLMGMVALAAIAFVASVGLDTVVMNAKTVYQSSSSVRQ